ncbi:MAG: RagB/SusD family nutrient uptake outer membrane protein [Bacteroidota bacterium]|nr:RagB/SusD family nutrient uptake outer membrane protein [Bacteroidota bacterium]
MKKIMKYLPILFMIFALLFSSCEDELEQLPPEQLSNELSLSTYANLELATNGIYTQLYSANWYGRDFTVIADLKGGNGKSSPLFSGRFQTEYNWANSEGSSSNFFDNAYILIARANNVINAIADFEQPGVTEAQLNQLEGEALFLRALAYFDLVRMYAQPYSYDPSSLGVPIVLVTEIGEPARNTVGEVYDQIVSDLTTAEAKIGTPDRGQTDPVGLASKPAVQALLAKVYLYMENWQGAADYATKVINNSNFSLYTTADYLTVWGTNAASEVIFEVFGNSTQSGWPGFDEIGYIYYIDGYGDVCASNDLLNLYEPGDVRAGVFTSHPDHAGFYWPTKYPGKESIRVNNIVVLRLAEMYLIRSEALLKGASVSGATAVGDYNAVRTNRGLTAAGTVSLEDVWDERRRELCFEGNELWDLSRTGRGLVRTDYSGAGDANISFPDYRWAMPIPATEMDRNPNMKQNPGY